MRTADIVADRRLQVVNVGGDGHGHGLNEI